MRIVPNNKARSSFVSHDRHLRKKVFLSQNEVPGIRQWATSELPPSTRITEHTHQDTTEIFQILEGSMTAIVNKASHHLEKEDFLVIEAGDSHAFENTGENSCKFLYTLIEH